MHKNGVEYIYVEDIGYDEYSQRTYIRYGNGVETHYTYDKEMRWLKTVDTANSQGVEYQRMRYEFDDVGNVTRYVNDCLNSNARYKTEQAYGYDALYQLTSVAGTAVNDAWGSYGMGVAEYEGSYSQVFAFDKIGNMKRKASSESVVQGKRVGDDLTYTLNYEYAEGFAHRLKRAGNDLQGWRNYEYDGNGNVIEERDGEAQNTSTLAPVTVTVTTNAAGEDVYGADYAWGYFKEDNSGAGARGAYRRTYEWNSRGQLIQSSDNDHTVYYVYGTDGERTNKFTSGSETLYFNSMWSWHKDSAIVGQYSKNIYLGTTRLVTKLHNSVNELPSAQSVTDNCYYYHSDHLGSAQLITDFQGNEYQRLEYTPYGELWIEKTSPVKETKFLPYKFTGKERDEETGLYYYGARYLDAKYSRWLSADPALGEYMGGTSSGEGGIFNTINFNLYHYAGNNPIKYIDPDGRKELMAEDAQGRPIAAPSVKSSLEMIFTKSTATLVVTQILGTKKLPDITIRLTNNVKTPEQRDNIPVEYNGYYYFPEDFPNGEWNVTGAGFNDKNKDIGPFLRTDAGRWVDTYTKNKDGEWEVTGEQMYDTGYLFHGSDGDKNIIGDNNENYSTWGCGRGKNDDINKLRILYQNSMRTGGSVTVKVED